MMLFGVFIGITSEFAFAEIKTDKSIYFKDEPVVISGAINFQDDKRVNIVEIDITNSNTNNAVVHNYIPIDDDNSFFRSYDSIAWVPGEYQVTINYNEVEETTEFEISDSYSSSSSSDNNNDEFDSKDSNNTSHQQESSATFSTLSDVPSFPTDLKANVVSSTQIDLSWSAPDNDSSIIGYKIEYRVNTIPTYSVVANINSDTDMTYSHVNLTSDTIHTYRIFAINSVGESEPSSNITVKTLKNENNRIFASNTSIEDIDTPTNVVAKAVSSTSVEISWDPPTQTYGQTIQNYVIKQEIVTNVYDKIASTSGSNTKYTISDLNTDETYAFVVAADYVLGSSDTSEKAIVTLISSFDNGDQNSDNKSQDNDGFSIMPDNVPDSPTNLEAKPISSTQIDLSWSAPKNDTSVTGYKVEVKTIDGEFYSTVVDNTESMDTVYSHTDLIPEITYIYRVSAINGVGTGDPSNNGLANTLSLDLEDSKNTSTQNDSTTQENTDYDNTDTVSFTVPSSPVELKSTPVSQSRIDLSWSAPIDIGSSALLGYKIESKTSDELDYSTLVTNTGTASVHTYSHTGLTAGSTYQYRIFAINSSGQSIPSDVSETTIISNSENQINSQELSSFLPVKVTLSADKNAYVSSDSIEISGIITDSTQNIPLGLRIISSNDVIVYVRSIFANDDNTFKVIIPPTQRQSSVWHDNEFTIEVTHNGRVQTTTTFEIRSENTHLETSKSIFNPQLESETNEPQQQSESSPSFLNDFVTTTNNELDILKSQNVALQSTNQQLQDENNQLKTQVNELNKRIERLDIILQEQIQVMMETLDVLNSEN